MNCLETKDVFFHENFKPIYKHLYLSSGNKKTTIFGFMDFKQISLTLFFGLCTFARSLFSCHIICAIYRCTIKWIKSPSRRWTAWLADPTVLSSGQISVCFLGWQLPFYSFHVCGRFITFFYLRVYFSCGMKLNLDCLLETLWEYLALICIYTKKRGGTHTFSLTHSLRLSHAHECISSK